MENAAESRQLQRSPALPPLLPHTPPPHSRSRGQRRFTAEEKLAFGSRPFVLKCNRAAAEARSASPSRVLHSSKHERSLVSSHSEYSLPSVEDSVQMQELLERMLPSRYGSFGNAATLRHSRSVDSWEGQPKMETTSDDSGVKRNRGRNGAPKAISVFTKDILERFRLSVLKVHRSLHDAFQPLERRCYFSALVGMAEVRTALSRVDAEAADELLVAVPTWPAVTLATFFEALVNSSPEAAIWELGAGLSRRGVWPNSSKKSLEDLQAYMKSHAGNGFAETNAQWPSLYESTRQKHLDEDMDSQNTAGHVQSLEDSVGRCFPLSLSPDLWNHFCTYLGLNQSEAKRLLSLLSDSTQMDLRTVFEAVRVTASPDASIPRLAVKAIARYDTLRDAFRKYCTDSENVLRWFQFRQLVRTLDVSDRWAMRLWALLISRITLTDSNVEQLMADAKTNGSIHEEVFVKRLSFWPHGFTMLQALKGQLRQTFGDIQEARKAFRKHGLPSESTVSPQRLGEMFRSLGITKCDPDVVLRATRSLRGWYEPLSFDCDAYAGSIDPLTLDDIIDAMRSQLVADSQEASCETQALRKQLRDVCGRSSYGKRKRFKRNVSAPPAFGHGDMYRDVETWDRDGSSVQNATVRDSKVPVDENGSSSTVDNVMDAKTLVVPNSRREHQHPQLPEQPHEIISQDMSSGDRSRVACSSPTPIIDTITNRSNRGADATLDPRKTITFPSPLPATRSENVSVTLDSKATTTTSVRLETYGFVSPTSSKILGTKEPTAGKLEPSGPLASPQSRSSPQLLPQRSPSVPHRLRHSSSVSYSRENRLGIEFSDVGAGSPDIGPGHLNSTLRGARRTMGTRSMSPLPTVMQTRNGFTSEPSRALQFSDVEPPRNAWATGSQWRTRRPSDTPAPKPTNPSDKKELQMLDTCSSFHQAEDDTKSSNYIAARLGTNLGTNLEDDVESFVQATQKSGDASSGKLKTTPWR